MPPRAAKPTSKTAKAAPAAHAAAASAAADCCESSTACAHSKKHAAHGHSHGKQTHGENAHGHGGGHGHSHAHAHGASAAAASSSASSAAAAGPSYRCAVSRTLGRALVATRDICAGETIVRDTPAVCMQALHNAKQTRACQTCGKFVGTLSDQLQALMRQSSSAADAPVQQPLPVLAPADAVLTPLVRCERADTGCPALYCSEAHRAQAWSSAGHRLLCLGSAPAASSASATANGESQTAAKRAKKEPAAAAAAAASSSVAPAAHPFAQFLAHAASQHEFFLAAAQIAAQIVQAVQAGSSEEDALKPWSEYAQKPWWDIVVHSDDEDEDEDDEDEQTKPAAAAAAAGGASASAESKKRGRQPDSEDESNAADGDESVKAHLRRVVSTSFSLLRSALFTHNGLKPLPFFTLQWYASIVGALRLNALAVEHPNPLRDYVAVVDHTLRQLRMQFMQEKKKKPSLPAEEEDFDEDEKEEEHSGCSTSSSSGEEESSDDEDDDDDDEDDARSKQTKIAAAAAAVQRLSARAEHDAILAQLQPILARIMRVRQLDGLERHQARAEARLARLKGSSSAEGDSEHARVRDLQHDSFDTPHYSWTLRATRAQQSTLRFSARLLPSFHASALYGIIARANHSCIPNASVEHAEQDATATLVAARNIKAGEQIFISYINEEQNKSARRAELRDHGFVCACERCAAEPSDDSDDDRNSAMDDDSD